MHSPPTAGRRVIRAAVVAVLAILAALLTPPPTVMAGTYTVYSCQTPTGTWTGTAGWTSSASVPLAGYESGSSTLCPSPVSDMSIQFALSGLPVRATSWLSLDFAAPPSTAISAYAIDRAFRLGWPVIEDLANRPYLMQIWHDDDPDANVLDFKKPIKAGDTLWQRVPSQVAGGGGEWNALHVRLSCWNVVGTLDCGPFPAQVAVSRVTIGLTDSVAPDGSATGGALAGSVPVRGSAGLRLHATDEGGGVYRATLTVDGTEVGRRVLDANGGSCADVEPGNDDAYEFAAPQPCLVSADGELQVDTASLRDGAHAVHATVEDAAGNETVVFDGTVQTHNAPIPTSAPTLSGEAHVGAQLTATSGAWDGSPSAYAHRWLRCDSDGASCVPVAGATSASYVVTTADAYHRMRVEVTAQNTAGSGSARSTPGALVTDAAGRTTPPADGDGGGGGNGGGGGGGARDGGGGGAGSGAGGGANATGLGGIQGIPNPLGDRSGHIANGDAASADARLTAAFQLAGGAAARHVSTRHGTRREIAGRLVSAAGVPIGNARVGIAWRVVGRRWIARPGSVRTRPDGRFTYLLPPGPSRDVRFAYYAFSDSRRAMLSNIVRIDVRAPVSIRVDRHRVSGQRVVRLRGRVGGGPIPHGGLLVTLQGFQDGWGWRTFRTVRTNGRGAWSTRYRFRLAAGRFGFRALVPHQGRFPFSDGRSRGVFVVVG